MPKNLSDRVSVLYKILVNPLRLEFYINAKREDSEDIDKKSTDDIIIVHLTI